jgi:hypothetical protein
MNLCALSVVIWTPVLAQVVAYSSASPIRRHAMASRCVLPYDYLIAQTQKVPSCIIRPAVIEATSLIATPSPLLAQYAHKDEALHYQKQLVHKMYA